MQCTYNVQIQDKFSSGTTDHCAYNQTTCDFSTDGFDPTVAIIAIFCGVLILTIICIAIGILSCIYIKVKRKGYTSIQNVN